MARALRQHRVPSPGLTATLVCPKIELLWLFSLAEKHEIDPPWYCAV